MLLAPHGNEQWELVHRLSQMRELETVPEYKVSLRTEEFKRNDVQSNTHDLNLDCFGVVYQSRDHQLEGGNLQTI